MAERQATLYQRLIGGLLGEDLSKLDEEERRRVAGQATSRAVQGLLMGEGLLGGLGGYRRERQADVLRRQQQAARNAQESQANQIRRQAGLMTQAVLEGRKPLTAAETMPDPVAPGQTEGLQLQRGPLDLARLVRSPEAQQALFANEQLREAVLATAPQTQAAPKYEFRNVEGVGLFAVNPADPNDMRLLQAEKKDVPAAQPQVKTVQLGDGMVQDQWVLPGQSSGTPLGVPYKSGGAKPLSSELTSRVVLAQSLRDSETEIAKLNPNIATEFWATAAPERMRSSELKQYESAAKRWAANLLYFKSGAAATDAEIESTWKQFFPLAGDDAATIAAKNRARLQEMRSVQNALNLSGVDINLATPYPVIQSENSEAYKSLKSGDVYMDSDGNYRTKT